MTDIHVNVNDIPSGPVGTPTQDMIQKIIDGVKQAIVVIKGLVALLPPDTATFVSGILDKVNGFIDTASPILTAGWVAQVIDLILGLIAKLHANPTKATEMLNAALSVA